MNKITTLVELAEKLGKRYNVRAWQKAGKQRLYFKGIGHNTKKMSTDVYISLESGEPIISVFIDCPSQPSEWIDSQQKGIIEKMEPVSRFIRRFFNFQVTQQPVEVVIQNAILDAEPVRGYYTQWREIRVAINRFGKLALRNRQFVVPYEGTKETAAATFVPLSEKAFAYLQRGGERMLEPYTEAPDYEALAIAYEEMPAKQAERDRIVAERLSARQEEARRRVANLVGQSGLPLLQAWKDAGCPHPAPAEVCEAKKASGLDWKRFVQSI